MTTSTDTRPTSQPPTTYEVYAINTGDWGPDELYGQSERPRFNTRAAADRCAYELSAVCKTDEAPEGLTYHVAELED